MSLILLPTFLSLATAVFLNGSGRLQDPDALSESPEGRLTARALDLPAHARAEAERLARASASACQGDDDRAESCGVCHTRIYKEWHGRAHSRAWTDPVYQQALVGKKHPERCHGCHIPASVQRRLGQRPKPRKDRLSEGVTCVACHLDQGAMAGPLGTKTSAHATSKHPGFTKKGSHILCASCHNTKIGPVLPLARDFEDADLAEKGKSCVGCHMPTVTRPIARDPESGADGPPRKGRQHRVLGPNDRAFCRKAFRIRARREGEHIVLSIENRAGHRVPGLVGRRFPFIAEQRNADGTRVTGETIRITAENSLKVAETREFRFVAHPKMHSLVVELRHQIGDNDVSLTEKSFSF